MTICLNVSDQIGDHLQINLYQYQQGFLQCARCFFFSTVPTVSVYVCCFYKQKVVTVFILTINLLQ